MNINIFFSSRRRHTRYIGDWSSDVCSSDLRDMRVFAFLGEYAHVARGEPEALAAALRSEERRVGKEWRTRRLRQRIRKRASGMSGAGRRVISSAERAVGIPGRHAAIERVTT